MTRLLALLALAPWGFQCSDAPRSSATPYAMDVDVVRAAWSLADDVLPVDRCEEPRIVVARTSCTNGCVYGYRVENEIVIDDRLSDADAHATVRHEAVHWLAWCTGYQATGDAGHADPLLWDDGVLGRAEGML